MNVRLSLQVTTNRYGQNALPAPLPLHAPFKFLCNLVWSLKEYIVLQISHKTWMKPYIRLNTEKRQTARNKFEKNMFKLINNSGYIKTCDSIKGERISPERKTQIKCSRMSHALPSRHSKFLTKT